MQPERRVETYQRDHCWVPEPANGSHHGKENDNANADDTDSSREESRRGY
jgi:hypothetical protein